MPKSEMEHPTLPPLKAILVDDEPPANEALQSLLRSACPNVEIAETCLGTEKASEAIIRHRPDLRFWTLPCPANRALIF